MDLNFLRSRQSGSDQPLGSRYKIVEQLGSGGFGQTFRAQDLHLPGHPLCVVKQLKPQVEDAKGLQVARRLFDTEAKVLYQLGSYPQIPHLLAHFEENREFYLAQELIEGHSLEGEFKTAPWDIPKVIDFLADVLETLAFVHDNRVIHRDLKPSNLIRRQSDHRIVVIDFGAVKQAGTQPAGSGVSHTISIGTQGYMPNEQLIGQPQFSSDVYAVGIMGIQALTGQPPRQLMPNAQTGELEWHRYVPHSPLELITILDTMVRYDFRTRYPSAKEALRALQSLPQGLGQYVTGTGASATSSARRPAPPAQPTALTVPAMAPQPQPPNRAKTSMATEVVPPPSTTNTTNTTNTIKKIPAIIIGVAILGIGLLMGRACTSATSNTAEVPVASQSPTAPTEPAPVEAPVVEPPVTEAAPLEDLETPALDTSESPPIEEPVAIEASEPPGELDAEIVPDEAPTTESPEQPAAALTPATAQTVVTTFYAYLSSQAWDQAKAQTSGSVAQNFNPEFFQQFQQVSVENLRIKNQTSEGIEFEGQNTYVYSDGAIQREARTFTVQLIDGQPRIVDSSFVRVIQAR
ncbi:serine/threonine protein kinase [Leptolyngbyaceae cyanobacterium CCMR0082]|uniref:non-specific serine/threonine protein kinase n=1 Tax=Adonisia turfae CCMR0082 TaxID=2304604 RepID=A0A6M0SFI7_9CYAN|nr:serine/threonine-protein kinase [Adonisia turfae]NEZ66731.1 serine/threonine protein kinase [Adonisia turfae CCMR0082]